MPCTKVTNNCVLPGPHHRRERSYLYLHQGGATVHPEGRVMSALGGCTSFPLRREGVTCRPPKFRGAAARVSTITTTFGVAVQSLPRPPIFLGVVLLLCSAATTPRHCSAMVAVHSGGVNPSLGVANARQRPFECTRNGAYGSSRAVIQVSRAGKWT